LICQFGLPIWFLAQLVYHPNHLPSIPVQSPAQSSVNPICLFATCARSVLSLHNIFYPTPHWVFSLGWAVDCITGRICALGLFGYRSLYTLRPRRFRARISPAFSPASSPANPRLPPSNPPRSPPNPPDIAIFIVTFPRAGLDA
jgi:hypothetical protein